MLKDYLASFHVHLQKFLDVVPAYQFLLAERAIRTLYVTYKTLRTCACGVKVEKT